MNVTVFFFYLFAAVLLFAAFRVITAKNPVYAVLYLMLAFSQAAGVWLLLEAEFLAIVLVLVYLGAVMVLFLFVVMMLDINIEGLRRGFWRHFPLALGVGGLIALEMSVILANGFHASGGAAAAISAVAAEASNARQLGVLLYTQYLYPVEIAAVILLVAMLTAIALTLRARKDTRRVDPSIQVRAKAADYVQVLSMAAVQPAAAAQQDEAALAAEKGAS
ncbi:MAG: NADH-quinone oxidoreductase subunit J [Burkholderiaceae bacterium]|jgi:NADH-quinone oxidoreductase subunit J|nr:NADH-quinone oxidoreductase subunit J [Burkholderiaceae bacterium]